MSTPLYKDVGPPYVVKARLRAKDGFVPTDVTATTLVVKKPSGATAEWATAELSKDADALLVQYALQTNDLNEVGFWAVFARCDVPGGTRRTEVGGFYVADPHNRLGAK